MQSKRDLPRHRYPKWLLVLLLTTVCSCAGTTPPQEPLVSTETPSPVVGSTSSQDTPTSTVITVPPQLTETVDAIEPSLTPQPMALPTLPHRTCDPTIDTINAAFIDDLGLPDDASIVPGAKFKKTWQVRNTGDCSWQDGTELVWITGDVLPGPQRIPVSQTNPDRDVTISIELTAPAKPGAYENFWRLRTPDGKLFGAVLFIKIIVDKSAPTPHLEPTLTLQPTQTPAPTATASPTASATPLPTATPTSDTYATCGALDDRFHAVVNQATALDIQVLCATGPTKMVPGQVQVFRQNVEQSDPHLRFRSFMILRDDTDKIYVLDGKDANTYEATVSIYSSSEKVPADEVPATCSGLAIPEGYNLPTGRIGATWCDESLWISTTGWPWEPAAKAGLEIQETTNGLLIKATTDATTTQTTQVYLIAIDFGTRRATVD